MSPKFEKLWFVLFHHKFGVSNFVVASEKEPSEDDVRAFLAEEDSLDPKDETEYFETGELEICSSKDFKAAVKRGRKKLKEIE